jgi:ubiquitin carboxyl-terminal hydrolase 5/13
MLYIEFFAVMSSLSLYLEYTLVAFISHMGTSTMCGHYVCHIKKEGKWIIFNDNKVAESVAPPKDLAYLYLYKRVAA